MATLETEASREHAKLSRDVVHHGAAYVLTVSLPPGGGPSQVGLRIDPACVSWSDRQPVIAHDGLCSCSRWQQ